MFTIEEIQATEREMETGADFPKFAAKLKNMGVTRADIFVTNGVAIYYGKADEVAESAPVYEILAIEPKSNAIDFKESLKNYRAGTIDHQTFGRQAAGAGIEKWIINLKEMMVTYLDSAGNEILVEKITNNY